MRETLDSLPLACALLCLADIPPPQSNEHPQGHLGTAMPNHTPVQCLAVQASAVLSASHSSSKAQ